MDKVLMELVVMVQNIAPKVWEITVRQALVSAFAWVLAGLFLGLFSVWAKIKSKASEDYSGEFEGLSVCLVIGMVIALIVGAMMLANPDYWAMKDLIGLVK